MEELWKELENLSLEERVKRVYFQGKAENLAHADIVERILSLIGKDWKTASVYIPSFTYPEGDPREGCSTDDYGVAVDPISLLEIPQEKLISFLDGEKKWCFNMDTLAEYVRRGKPENPITRRRLPKEVLLALQVYEKETKSVVLKVTNVQGESHNMKALLGTPFVEIALDALRGCSACEGSILNKVIKYRVEFDLPGWTFETELDGPLQIFIKKGTTVTYLRRLLASCQKRYSLESIANHIEYELGIDIVNSRVIDVILYYSQLAGQGNIFYANLMFVIEGQSHSVYDFLPTVSDYYKTLPDVIPEGATLDYSLGYEDFIEHYRPPQDLQRLTRGFQSNDGANMILDIITSTVNSYLSDTIAKRDFFAVKKLFNLPGYYRFRSDVSMEIINAFTPEEVDQIFGEGVAMVPELITEPIENIPRDFVASGYYAKYLDFNDVEIPIMTAYFLGKKPITDPVLQAKFVATFDSVELLEQYKKTLDYERLYGFISDMDAEKVALALSPNQKARLALSHGYGIDVPIRYSYQILEEYIKQDKPLNTVGFNMLFLGTYDPPGIPLVIPVKDLYPLLLRMAKTSPKNFTNITIGLQRAIRDTNRDDYPLTQKFVTTLYCKLIHNKSINPQLKLDTFAQLFDDLGQNGEPLSNSVVQKLYSCFSFADAVELYDLTVKKQFLPYLSEEKILEMAARHDRTFELAVEVGAISQRTLTEIAKKQLTKSNAKSNLYAYLTLEGFQILDMPVSITWYLTEAGRSRVTSRYAQKYLRANQFAQRELVHMIKKYNLDLGNTGVLSIIGVLQLLEEGTLIDLSGLYNIFEDVEVTPEMKAKILSYPYLKLMYGDKLDFL